MVLVFSVSGQYGLDRDHLQAQQCVSGSDWCAVAGVTVLFMFHLHSGLLLLNNKQGIGGFVLR